MIIAEGSRDSEDAEKRNRKKDEEKDARARK